MKNRFITNKQNILKIIRDLRDRQHLTYPELYRFLTLRFKYEHEDAIEIINNLG
jgi:hypothetical protein